MGKSNKKSSSDTGVSISYMKKVRYIVGILLLVMALFLIFSIVSFWKNGVADQSVIHDANSSIQPQNLGSISGAKLSDILVAYGFGYTAIAIPLMILIIGIKCLCNFQFKLWKWLLFLLVGMIWTSVFLSFLEKAFNIATVWSAGGMHGRIVVDWLDWQVGYIGLVCVIVATAAIFMVLTGVQATNWYRGIKQRFTSLRAWIKTIRATNTVASEEAIAETEDEDNGLLFNIEVTNNSNPHEEIGEDANTLLEITNQADDLSSQIPPAPTTQEVPIEKYNPRWGFESYKFPTLELLENRVYEGPSIDKDEQQSNADRIRSTLASFGIEIDSIKATVGPTVTLYEITLREGVRISKIKHLEDDIALSLSALGIRIIAPIPGKGTIGIEVPNAKPRIVSIRSILADNKFLNCTYELPVALGRTITNEVCMFDLCKMPHLLVAGATGQGKSVGLNAIITSLLYKKHPAELKFVLIDPKQVEFSIYAGIERNYLAKLPDEDEPIITDVNRVLQTLNSVVNLMEKRYSLVKLASVRNIGEYNEKFLNRLLNPNNGHEYMPYIVVVIDEFGDLILTAGKEIETPITRIAQKARAVGIHMIIATQRPTTNIITGTIKANFPARIAFKVTTAIDSRTILDRVGANQLIGKGDMLFLHSGDPVRVQCAFVETKEVERINAHILEQRGAEKAYELPEAPNENNNISAGASDYNGSGIDPMLLEAARLVVLHQSGSTSLIQRRFSIGYNRAGRIMDQLEKLGVVGAAEGSKPREVYCADEAALSRKLSNI